MKHEQGEQWAAAQPDEQAGAAAQGGQGAQQKGAAKPRRTRVSMAWVAALVALVLLVFLLVFILQNLDATTVSFLGFSGSLPLALAMLFSAIAGAALVGLLGGARMIQLRRAHRKASR